MRWARSRLMASGGATSQKRSRDLPQGDAEAFRKRRGVWAVHETLGVCSSSEGFGHQGLQGCAHRANWTRISGCARAPRVARLRRRGWKAGVCRCRIGVWSGSARSPRVAATVFGAPRRPKKSEPTLQDGCPEARSSRGSERPTC